jgi:NAD(P)-dependent dehydrogenase (short-subunit alcohol dehydrogenase family)
MRGQELAGKVAIVTGGAGGLGRATVELFVEEGAQVVIGDVDARRGEALTEQLGPTAAFKQTDVADSDAIQDLVDFAVARFGGLHVMCNNAGLGGSLHTFLKDDFRDFERVMAVNIYGVMVGSQRAARHMVKFGGGSIINTTSIAAIKAGARVMTYRASKAAVSHFSRSIAVELAEHGIRVNCIAPGHIATDMTHYDMGAMMHLTQPLRRQGMPRDFANAAVFLASERAAQITGIELPVDGGTSAGMPVNVPREIMAARGREAE